MVTDDDGAALPPPGDRFDPRIESAYDSGELAFDPGGPARYADGRAGGRLRKPGQDGLPWDGRSGGHGWQRVLLKLSGEAMAGEGKLGVDPDVVARIATEIAAAVRLGVQVAVVVGGGNYFRGAELSSAAWSGPAPTTWASWAL